MSKKILIKPSPIESLLLIILIAISGIFIAYYALNYTSSKAEDIGSAKPATEQNN